MGLYPIGARRYPHDEQSLKTATTCVLQFLDGFHAAGYVHRDLRWPNVLSTGKGWMVIDFELSSRLDTNVFWHHDCLPPAVDARTAVYTIQSDLYLVGIHLLLKH